MNRISRFSACNVKWIGLRGDDLQLIPESALQELKPRDFQIAKGLLYIV
jgi:meiotic recombination protein SPO11